MGVHELDEQLLGFVGYHARTVRRELLDPVSPLFPSVGLCDVCWGPLDQGPNICRECNKQFDQFGDELADQVVPLSYAVRGHPTLQQFYSDMNQYKFEPPSLSAKRRLKALVLLYRIHHLTCLETAVEHPISSVIAVPSGRNRPNHPLPDIAAVLSSPGYGPPGIPRLSARYVGQPRQGRSQRTNPDEFSIDGQVSGHVLIVEDTWVQGHNAQSIAIKARRQGAVKVSIIVIARMLNYGYSYTKALVDTWEDDDHFDPYACLITGDSH